MKVGACNAPVGKCHPLIETIILANGVFSPQILSYACHEGNSILLAFDGYEEWSFDRMQVVCASISRGRQILELYQTVTV